MASDGINVPLLLRTAQTLRERFAFLRSLGQVVAVMEERPLDCIPPPGSKTVAGHVDQLPFVVGAGPQPRQMLGAAVERNGRIDTARSLWFGGEISDVSHILRVCGDANGFVPFIRRKYGLPADCGTTNPQCRWIWTVFELAETRPPFTVLTLGRTGEVFRCGDSGCIVSESFFAAAAEQSAAEQNPFTEIVRHQTFRPQRYWQLDDLVEASIAAMDLIEVAIPSLAVETGAEQGANLEETAGGGDENPEDTTKPGGRRKRNREGLTVGEWVTVMRVRDPGFRYLSELEAAEISNGDFGARTIGTCDEWRAMKEELRTAVEELAERAKEELADRQSEGEDVGGLRLSATKHGTGIERLTPEELKRERAVRRLLSKAQNRGDAPTK